MEKNNTEQVLKHKPGLTEAIRPLAGCVTASGNFLLGAYNVQSAGKVAFPFYFSSNGN